MEHSKGFIRRRVLNWFPLGVAYALLYMARYNLTVAKTSLGQLMTKEDFGWIFGAGTFVYALSFLINGPLVDRLGGRLGMLLALGGTFVSNLFMGLYLISFFNHPDWVLLPIREAFGILYSFNMYFQSFGAVSIVKVNSHWFHVTERGKFSGVFGAMIASGIFLAFTVNEWFLSIGSKIFPRENVQWIVFLVPASLVFIIFFVEWFFLKERPSQAGLKDFKTGDATSEEKHSEPIPIFELYRRILTHPVLLVIAGVEFCTGVLRNGVMHWFPIYAKEVWALPSGHPLRNGGWSLDWITILLFLVAMVSVFFATRTKGRRKGFLAIFSALAVLAPFLQAGWGGLLFVAGVIGGNVAGWVSDLFFQSRRAPSAGGLYLMLTACTVLMIFFLSEPKNKVNFSPPDSPLKQHDRILRVDGGPRAYKWADISKAIACIQPKCVSAYWDAQACVCTTKATKNVVSTNESLTAMAPVIKLSVERMGQEIELEIQDPLPVQRAGDRRVLSARPELPLSPYWLGVLVFMMSLCVIGSHGVLSGTATMDFGGSRAAATATGVIDGFVYLGTALQSVCLGYISSQNWLYWPIFLAPFGLIGFLLLLRIWKVVPQKRGH